MADADEGSGTTGGLVIGHLPISIPVAIVCGLFMRAAARMQLMLVTRRRQPNPQRTDARSSASASSSRVSGVSGVSGVVADACLSCSGVPGMLVRRLSECAAVPVSANKRHLFLQLLCAH